MNETSQIANIDMMRRPFQTSLTFKRVAGAGIMAAPWLFGYDHRVGTWVKALHLLSGASVLVMSLLSTSENAASVSRPVLELSPRDRYNSCKGDEVSYQFGADGADYFDCAL